MAMEPVRSRLIEVDLHRLVLRFAHLRLPRAKALESLVRSIEQSGQLTPVVAVAESDQQWVRIDGYRRLAALRQCGHDTAWTDLWSCDVPQALFGVLARGQARPWQSIEEAQLIQELHTSYSYSQVDIARQVGRDVSWVNRRLTLMAAFPEDLLKAVSQGQLSLWAATRILVPLARANTDHARRLLDAVGEHPLSTRNLPTWFRHYQRANRVTRVRMVDNPALFLEALQAQQDAKQAKALAQGPEGAWLKDVNVITQLLKRLRKQVATLFDPAQSVFDRRLLSPALGDMMAELALLQADLTRYDAYDPRPHPTSHPDSAPATHASAGDQSSAARLTQYGAPGHPAAAAGVQADAGP
jgi:ParB family chromosome partitioning protein